LLKENNNLTVVGCRGFSIHGKILGYQIPLALETPFTNVFQQNAPLIFSNVPVEYPEFINRTSHLKNIKSWIGAPLIIQDHSIGIITLHSNTVNQFNKSHLHLITTFAGQVAVALENARLYTEMAHSAERFKILYSLSRVISAKIRSEDIFPAIHKAVSQLMTPDFFGLSLFDPRTQIMRDAYRVEHGKHLPLSSRPVDKGLTASVLRNGKSLHFSNFDSATANAYGSIMFANQADSELPQSVLIVPLSIGSNCIGTMSVHKHKPNMFDDGDREILELLASNVAIAIENARLFDEIQQLAITDPLTKLYNRRKFEELSTKEFERSRRYHHPLCLIMIDLDQFKQINDTYGHIVGDQVLSGLASLCRNNLRVTDILARYGGEEFVILLPETSAEQAMATAERLRQDCAQTEFSSNQGEINITISIGVDELTADCSSLEMLIDRADQALYASKNFGRNTCTFWSPELAKISPAGVHTSHP
jgi:diguanylate cyclase (GGDEF)-like protein